MSGSHRLSLALSCLGLGAMSAYIGFTDNPFPIWVLVIALSSVVAGGFVILTGVLWRKQCVGGGWVAAAILFGLILRILVMQADRDLSDDAVRYHWDGKVLVQGINPYLYAPDDPELGHLRTERLDQVLNHPDLHTVYPPLAQMLFAVAYLIHPGGLTGLNILSLLAELCVWYLLARELSRKRSAQSFLLFAVWSPLAILEGYLPGHVDLLALPLLLLSIFQAEERHPLRAGLFLAAACLIKPFPVLFVPAFVREFGLRNARSFLLAFLGAGVVCYLPFLGAGAWLYRSMLLMFQEWSFNGSIGAILEAVLGMRQGHLLSAALTIGFVLLGAWRGRDLLSRLLLAMVAWIIFAPTLFPWYLLLLLPLLCLRPDPALISLCVLAPLAEEVIGGYGTSGLWSPALWPLLLQYVPFYILLAAGLWKRWGMFRTDDLLRSIHN